MPANQTATTNRILLIDSDALAFAHAPGGAADFLRNGESVTTIGELAGSMVRQAVSEKKPFAVAILRILEDSAKTGAATFERLWESDSDLHIIAFSEQENPRLLDIHSEVSQPDKLLLLACEPQPLELQQLVHAMREKRNTIVRNRQLLFEKTEQLLVAQEALRHKNQHLELASRMARVGYGSMDLATQVLQLSDNACLILDVHQATEFSIADLLEILPAKDRIKFRLLLDEAIYRENDFEYKFSFSHRSGDLHHILTQVTCEHDSNSAKTSLFFVVRDVTEDEMALQAVQHASLHDTLTGLPNRAKFNDHLERALKQSLRTEMGVSLILLDLDHFKEVNDSMGHPVGDGLLQEFASRLNGCIRETDMVARLGGDEFAIVQSLVRAPEDVRALLDRLYAAMGEPLCIEDQKFTATFSTGVAVAPNNGKDIATILRNADLALYRAKQDGRGVYRFFDSEMDKKLRERQQIEADLEHAIERQEFSLRYQPIVDANSQKVAAFETLVRWEHPTRGTVPPDDFIWIAESTAAIVPIGEWILEQACEDAMHWPDHTKLAVNISAVQLQYGDFPAVVKSMLEKTGLAATRLELEITETAFLRNNEESLRKLNAIKELGVRIAMDDFGIGYSSLSYLRNFPFDKIKLDKSFVDKCNEPESLAIISAVAGLGQSLSMETCAEGVETKEQFDLILDAGYALVQGFYFGKPSLQSDILELSALGELPPTPTLRAQEIR